MSESLRIFLRVNRSISAFYNPDPTQQSGTSVNANTLSAGETLHCFLGNLDKCRGPVYEPEPCISEPVTNLRVTSDNPMYDPPAPYDNYGFSVTFAWDPVPNATSYIITTDDTTSSPPTIIYTPGTTDAIIYYNGNNGDYVTTIITVTAQTPCGPTSASVDAFPCFLAGSIVQMANGSIKEIEDVKVGDKVLGAFGEINTVLALHRPLVGQSLMCNINDEHSTTNHHPHISVDKKFYCGNPALVSSSTYGKVHKVINGEGAIVNRLLTGLKPERIQKLTLGVDLKTVDGSKKVTKLETFSLPPETQLYNLVISGSHTYHVDGYAVTGWPAEDDFNYDTWT